MTSGIYHDAETRRARIAFAQHGVYRESPAAWEIRRGSTLVYAVEIIASPLGALIVHGDIGPVHFGGFGRYESTKSTPVELYAAKMLLWMGSAREVSEYVVEKARFGSRRDFDAYDADKGVDDLNTHIEDLDSEDDKRFLREQIPRAASGRDIEDLDGMRSAITGRFFDAWEWVHDIGRVPDAQLYYAHAAVRRLCELRGLFE